MQLYSRVTVRLSSEQKYTYEKKAVRLGLSLAEYIRQQLEACNSRAELLPENNVDSSDKAVILEMLLILRQLTQPKQVNLAQSELRRLGYSIWSSNNESN